MHNSIDTTSDISDHHNPFVNTQSDLGHQADTVHYISPASTARTENEADFIYAHFGDVVQKTIGLTEPTVSSISCVDPEIQRMIVIVRPEAMKYKDVILRTITHEGMSIISERNLHLTPEQVSELYSQYYGLAGFPHLVISMCSEPVHTMSLCGINIIERFKCLVGPDKTLQSEWFYPYSVRTRFGLQDAMDEAMHASENFAEASKENRFFFPDSILEPFISQRNKVEDYCDLYYRETLVNGLTELVRVKPVEPIIYLAEWLLLNNPYQPRFPYNTALSAT